MCELCDELNCQIQQCKRMEEVTKDGLMREALASLIKSYEEDRATLHPVATDEG